MLERDGGCRFSISNEGGFDTSGSFCRRLLGPKCYLEGKLRISQSENLVEVVRNGDGFIISRNGFPIVDTQAGDGFLMRENGAGIEISESGSELIIYSNDFPFVATEGEERSMKPYDSVNYEPLNQIFFLLLGMILTYILMVERGWTQVGAGACILLLWIFYIAF